MSKGSPGVPRQHWTEAQLRALRTLYPDTPTRSIAAAIGRSEHAVGMKALALGLRKSAAFMASDFSGRLKPGNVPANKGKHYQAGGRSKETQFKPGNKPHTTQPVGSYRINHDGHLQRKVSEASGNNSQRWRSVAELVWCAAHGPLPAKHIVVFKPGMKTAVLDEITVDKVECISLAENARRNHPRNKHPELAKLVQLKGVITRQVNRINRAAREAAEQARP
jgi:hypothetical protein